MFGMRAVLWFHRTLPPKQPAHTQPLLALLSCLLAAFCCFVVTHGFLRAFVPGCQTNMFDYALLFLQKSVTGSKLRQLNHKKLQSLGVDDTLHRKMIMACIEEVLGLTTNTVRGVLRVQE